MSPRPCATIFEDDGIDVVLGAETQTVEGRSGDRVRLRVKTPAGEQTIEGSDILVAAGRTPNTRDIGLEEAGIELDARGFIKVDDRLQTTAPGVWAMGECAGSPQFTHVAFDDFRVVRDNLAGKPAPHETGSSRTAPSSIPSSRASDSTRPRRSSSGSRCGSPGCR